MKSCESHEIDLSSLLDGEAAPEVAAAAVEHAMSCASCGDFFRAARRLAEPARALAENSGGLSRRRAEELWLGVRRVAAPAVEEPRRGSGDWARGLRAAALVAIGLGGGYVWSSLGSAGELLPEHGSGAAVPVAMREAASMDERRFVALADELMRAEPRYQRAMLEVLRLVPALETGEGLRSDEARPFVRASLRDDDPSQGNL